MIQHKISCGKHLNDAVHEMVILANNHSEQVESEFNGNKIIVNPGDNVTDIIKKYDDDCALRAEAYRNSPERKIEREKEAEKQRIKSEELKTFSVDAPAKMTLSDADFWDKQVTVNNDGYGSGVIRYAEKWACLMEGQISKGIALKDCAKKLSFIADTEGITGFMYGCAVSILAKAWIYGEELRRWHNIDTQCGNEGEKANESGGTLNPALLSFSTNSKTGDLK